MKVGDTVQIKDGSTGTVLQIYWRGAASSTVSYIGSVDIKMNDGTVLMGVEPDGVKIINESR